MAISGSSYLVEAVIEILDGVQGARTDIAVLNATCALVVAGDAKKIEDGIDVAEKSISTGNAGRALEQLIETSKKMANPTLSR